MDNSLSIRNLHFENIPLDQEFEDRIGQGERRLVGNKDYRRVGKEDTDIEVNRGTDTKICVCSITRVLSILSLAGRSIDCWKTLNDETYTRDASWLPRSLVAVVLFIERYLQQ